jgi:hypothetical protein
MRSKALSKGNVVPAGFWAFFCQAEWHSSIDGNHNSGNLHSTNNLRICAAARLSVFCLQLAGSAPHPQLQLPDPFFAPCPKHCELTHASLQLKPAPEKKHKTAPPHRPRVSTSAPPVRRPRSPASQPAPRRIKNHTLYPHRRLLLGHVNSGSSKSRIDCHHPEACHLIQSIHRELGTWVTHAAR